jgi:hypothetical protein
MKIRLVAAKLFHANVQTDRQAEMTKLIVAFRNFTSAPKNVYRAWTRALLHQKITKR